MFIFALKFAYLPGISPLGRRASMFGELTLVKTVLTFLLLLFSLQ